MRVNPKGAQSAGSCPSSLSSSRSSIAFSDLCRALRAAPTFSGSISVNGLPQCGVEAHMRHICRQIAAENGRRPFVRTSKLLD